MKKSTLDSLQQFFGVDDEDDEASPQEQFASSPTTCEISYECFKYFAIGFAVSTAASFLILFLMALAAKEGTSASAQAVFLLFGFLKVSEAEFQIGYSSVFIAASSFGVSVGIYCIIYAIYKGSKNHITELYRRNIEMMRFYDDRIAELERKLGEDQNEDYRDWL